MPALPIPLPNAAPSGDVLAETGLAVGVGSSTMSSNGSGSGWEISLSVPLGILFLLIAGCISFMCKGGVKQPEPAHANGENTAEGGNDVSEKASGSPPS